MRRGAVQAFTTSVSDARTGERDFGMVCISRMGEIMQYSPERENGSRMDLYLSDRDVAHGGGVARDT